MINGTRTANTFFLPKFHSGQSTFQSHQMSKGETFTWSNLIKRRVVLFFLLSVASPHCLFSWWKHRWKTSRWKNPKGSWIKPRRTAHGCNLCYLGVWHFRPVLCPIDTGRILQKQKPRTPEDKRSWKPHAAHFRLGRLCREVPRPEDWWLGSVLMTVSYLIRFVHIESAHLLNVCEGIDKLCKQL